MEVKRKNPPKWCGPSAHQCMPSDVLVRELESQGRSQGPGRRGRSNAGWASGLHSLELS
jgi:hypothetical protein